MQNFRFSIYRHCEKKITLLELQKQLLYLLKARKQNKLIMRCFEYIKSALPTSEVLLIMIAGYCYSLCSGTCQ